MRPVAGLAFLLPAALFGAAPTVLSVVNGISGEARLSPGVIARVHYTPAAPTDFRTASSGPYDPRPTITATVGGTNASVVQGVESDANGGAFATLTIPRGIATGSTTLVFTNRSGSSAPFRIFLDTYSPGLRTPYLRCEGGQQVATYNATGLGPTSSTPVSGNPQLYPTLAQPTVTVGGVSVAVPDSQLMANYDVYEGSFKIPPSVPEGLQPTVLSIGGVASNPVNLLVGTQHLLASYGYASADFYQAAPQSLVSAYSCGVKLASGTGTADPSNPVSTLAGATVTVTDFAGAERKAGLLAASAGQVTYLVPEGTASGRALVTIAVDGEVVSRSPLDIDTVQPGIFWGTAYLVRVHADGTQTVGGLEQMSWYFERYIDLGPETDQVYLVVRATGLRNRSPEGKVTLQMSGSNFYNDLLEAPAQYAGALTGYPGVEQINVLLPRFPTIQSGQEGGFQVRFVIDGKPTNEIDIVFYRQ